MLGTAVRLRRQQMLMTQTHLAEAAGLSLATIKRLERGENVSFETMRAVAAVLGPGLHADDADPSVRLEQAQVDAQASHSYGFHGEVRALNETARRSGMLHAGPAGFVSSSPDAVFLVARGFRGRRVVKRYGFGAAMRPERVSHVVAGGDEMSRRNILAAVADPGGDAAVYEVLPPVRGRGATGFLELSRIAMAGALACLVPLACYTAMDVWYASMRPLGNSFSFSRSASVTEAAARTIDWSETYGKDPVADKLRRDDAMAPDPFRDLYKREWAKVRKQTTEDAR